MLSQGLYILGNDRVYELLVASVTSFRATNPGIPICLIPFDDSDYRVRGFCKAHDITIFADRDILQGLDALSMSLHGKVVGQYRKFACWSGDFEKFIFIDLDTVALMSFAPVFAYLEEYDYIAGHSDYPNIRAWTWRDSAYSSAGLTAEQINYAANTGFFASKVSIFSPEKLQKAKDDAMKIRAHMELGAYEQSFLNYFIVTLGIKYTSLARMGAAQPDADIPCECWPGDPAWRLNAKNELFYKGQKKSVLFMHWAGCWWPTKFERRMEHWLTKFGFRPKIATVRRRMRLGRVWRHYRYLST